MLDDIREWISDNLRYILLGVAAVLIIVIAVFAVRLVRGIGSSGNKKEAETQKTTEKVIQEDETEAGTVQTASSNLVRNQADILELMTSYYTARAAQDYDTIAQLCEVFDDSTRTEMENADVAIESYSNIMTYSKAGMTDGSYVVYVYFDAKITGIDTLAPALREWYLITDSDGSLLIADKDDDAELEAFIESMRTDEDVQALMADVNTKLEEAEAEDEDLKNFLEGTSDGSSDDTSDSGDTSSVTTTSLGTMMVTTAIYFRSEPDASSTSYGMLYEGAEVEVLENLDSGWSHISYTSDGTTTEGYVMTQYLTEM